MTVVDFNPVLRSDGKLNDPLCVCGKCFAPVLASLIAATDRLRPAETGMQGRMVTTETRRKGRDTNVSHNRRLVCDEAGVNPRKFQGYLSAEWATVSLRDADALLCAFGRADVVRSLTVLVRRAGLRMPLDRHACELLSPEGDVKSAPGLVGVESAGARIPLAVADGRSVGPEHAPVSQTAAEAA